jgi:peptidoglycan hydrolase-like protein with peptidoglycan-binding domain
MSKHWHDINDPGIYVKPSGEEARPDATAVSIGDAAAERDAGPRVEYAIKFVRAIEPENGFQNQRPYDIEGEIEPLTEPVSQPAVTLYPVGVYNGAQDDFVPAGIAAFPDKDNRFRATCTSFCNAIAYENDAEKPEGATWELKIRATGNTARKEVVSEAIVFPKAPKALVDLRLDHYDDAGAAKSGKPKEGKDYVAGGRVKELQRDLISFRYLQSGKDDGYFGKETDEAVREFQKCAIDKYRMPLKLGKLVEVKKTLEMSGPDGIVGQKTRDEMDAWKKNGWVKPLVILRHGEYDDEGVATRHGEKGGDDHHINKPIQELQRELKKRGFEDVGLDDGWFHDKTKQAVIDFQECALDVMRVVNGNPVEVEVTFKGKANGVHDEASQIELEWWKTKDYYAPKSIPDSAMIFAAPGHDNGEVGWFIVEENDAESFWNEVDCLDHLSVEITRFHDSCERVTIDEAKTKQAKELEEKTEEVFPCLAEKPKDAIQELLAVKSNPRGGKMVKWVYIRPYKVKNGEVKGHFRRNNDATVKKALNKWLQIADDGSKKWMEAKVKARIWETEKFDKQWPWKFKMKPGQTGKDTTDDIFEVSCQAQFCRFVAGAAAASEFDLRERKLQLAGSGSVSYTAAAGKVSGDWYLPDEKGRDIFKYLNLSENARNVLLKAGSTCILRLTTELSAKVFAGVSLVAAVSLPCIDLGKAGKVTSKKKKDEGKKDQSATVGVGGKGFVGVSADGEISVALEWKDPSNEKFKSLMEVGVDGGVSFGAGVQGKFEIQYKGGKFHMTAGVMWVFGAGGQTGGDFELDANAAIDLLAYLYNCVDFHRIEAVLPEAFGAYINATFGWFIGPEMALLALAKKAFSFVDWLTQNKKSPTKFSETKNNIRININDIEKLRSSPPEALGQLLQTIVEVPEAEDFNAILKVLGSASKRGDDAHRLKWIIRSFYDPKLSRTDGLDEPMKKVALEEGIRKLKEFGKLLAGYDVYKDQLKDVLDMNEIKVK